MLGVFTAEEMRRLDQRAITELGIPGATLMENAGRGAAEAIVAALPALGAPRRGARVVIVCGKGGNGGDGFVVARWLKRHGARPTVLLVSAAAEVGGDAGRKLEELRRAGIRPRPFTDDRATADMLARAHLVVDALLGTGSRGVPEGGVARAIELINASGRPVVALDIPSGLSANTGAHAGAVIGAAMTLTFAGLKRGLVSVARRRAGRPGDGDPDRRPRPRDRARRHHVPARARRRRRPLPAAAARGSQGDLRPPAPGGGLARQDRCGRARPRWRRCAAASGSSRSRHRRASSRSSRGLVLEAMTEPLPETAARTLALKAREVIVELAGARDAVAIGPGIGLDDETAQVVRSLVARASPAHGVDADGLTALAGHLDVLRDAPAARCLTPHPGEMARMLGARVDEVQRDRIETAREFATRHRVHLVLKGARA